MNSNHLYSQFEGMVHSFAWKYSRKSGVPVEDLLGEAQLIFCEAVESYKAGKSSFSTHLYSQLHAITHSIDKDALYGKRHDSYDDVYGDTNPGDLDNTRHYFDLTSESLNGSFDPAFQDAEYAEYLKAMPRDARVLALWHKYGELDAPETAKVKKGQLLTPRSIHWRKAKYAGWTWARTQKAFEDLTQYMGMFRESVCLETV